MEADKVHQIALNARDFLDDGDISGARAELGRLPDEPLYRSTASSVAHELRQLRDQNARLEADIERMGVHLHDAIKGERAAWEQYTRDADAWNARLEAELRAMILEILDHPPGLEKLTGEEFWESAGKRHHVTVRHARWPEPGLSPATVLDRLHRATDR